MTGRRGSSYSLERGRAVSHDPIEWSELVRLRSGNRTLGRDEGLRYSRLFSRPQPPWLIRTIEEYALEWCLNGIGGMC